MESADRLDDHIITMFILDNMGFKVSNYQRRVMVCSFGEYKVRVFFPDNILGKTRVSDGADFIELKNVRTVGDLKRLYRVLTGEEWKALAQ